jgi:hypothetical protein
MRVIETVVAWSLLIGGGIVGTWIVVIGMLELLPDIVRMTWNGRVHW